MRFPSINSGGFISHFYNQYLLSSLYTSERGIYTHELYDSLLSLTCTTNYFTTITKYFDSPQKAERSVIFKVSEFLLPDIL